MIPILNRRGCFSWRKMSSSMEACATARVIQQARIGIVSTTTTTTTTTTMPATTTWIRPYWYTNLNHCPPRRQSRHSQQLLLLHMMYPSEKDHHHYRTFSSLSKTTTATKTKTLFQLPNLHHPSDFIKLALTVQQECDSIRKQLSSSLIIASTSSSHTKNSSSSSSIHQAKQTLHQLDDISNIVCTVIDAAELCRSVHSSVQWRDAASDAFGIVSDYIGNLNADVSLYHCLRYFVFEDYYRTNSIMDVSTTTMATVTSPSSSSSSSRPSNTILSQLPPEYQRMAYAMRREFERDGIHLTYTQREEARELNNVIVGLESLFTKNITEKTKFFPIHGREMMNEVEKIIPRHVLGQLIRTRTIVSGSPDNIAEATATAIEEEEDATATRNSSLTLSSDNLLCNTLLAHSPHASLRKEIYYQANTSVPENLNVLDSLIRYRHLHSTLLGYPSYAHRVLCDRMVGTPENVVKFLHTMQERSRLVYQKDMELLLQAKKYIEGGEGSSSSSTIEAWDIPFYTNLIKSQRQHLRWKENNIDGGNINDEAESSQFSGYFSVENSIEGMKVLVKDLFGISMQEVNIPLEERWDIDTTREDAEAHIPSSKASLRKFEFHHDEEGPLGTMYFDLHPREGKFLHAAHFTIRCGRIRLEDDTTSTPTLTSDDHQLPIVALVCNLTPSSVSSSSSSTLLSHSEVETLYHEFGHGLHSLLSRTCFQHLSGTRAALDFVETPSHIFETYARDPSFLSRTLAKHYLTGIPLSERQAQHLAWSSHLDFRGVEIQTQIVHSQFDQALFGSNPCTPSLGGCNSTEMFERLHVAAGVPYAPGTHWHTKFGHLVTYGAGYYGYLYAQTFAADIWRNTFGVTSSSQGRNDVSSSDAVRRGGMKLWKEMLVHGGGKDPKDMIRAVLGREPSVDPFFRGMSWREK